MTTMDQYPDKVLLLLLLQKDLRCMVVSVDGTGIVDKKLTHISRNSNITNRRLKTY